MTDVGAAALDRVANIAREASAAAMEHYGTTEADYKVSASGAESPVTRADHAANRVITERLREYFPEDAILSEESKDTSDRLEARRVWIVDPLDGTKEFLARNGEFAIMIGLAVDGEPVLGVVYRPAPDVLYAAVRGGGVRVERDGRRDELRRDAASVNALRMVGSRSHGDPLIDRMREALGIEDVRASGSVGVKCGLIAEGECDLYIHPVPYLKEWDTCAPEVILREAGGDVTDCRGERLRYNKADPRQPDGILACAPGVSAEVLRRIGPIYADEHHIEPTTDIMSEEIKSDNIHWHAGDIARGDRERANGHRSAILWFTGLSGSGKSTLARALEAALFERGCRAYVLDGDNVRHGLNRDLGFSPEDRTENIRRVGEVAKLFTDAGLVVLTAFISPYREDRDAVRALVDDGDFVEVHVDCDLAECEARDPKGLYEKARSGEIPNFTGISAPYEAPESPEVIVRTDEHSVDECVEQLLAHLESHGYLERSEPAVAHGAE